MFSNCCGCKKKYNTKEDCKIHIIQNSQNGNFAEKEVQVSNEKKCSVKSVENFISAKKTIVQQPLDVDVISPELVDVEVEITSNDDGEVFWEGVGPPIKLADNLGIHMNREQSQMYLPMWFSQDKNYNKHELTGQSSIDQDKLILRKKNFFCGCVRRNASEYTDNLNHVETLINSGEHISICKFGKNSSKKLEINNFLGILNRNKLLLIILSVII